MHQAGNSNIEKKEKNMDKSNDDNDDDNKLLKLTQVEKLRQEMFSISWDIDFLKDEIDNIMETEIYSRMSKIKSKRKQWDRLNDQANKFMTEARVEIKEIEQVKEDVFFDQMFPTEKDKKEEDKKKK